MNDSTTSTFSRWRTHFLNWREWEFNPIVVKELRQSVRSWAVTGMLFMFLLVLLGTAIVMVAAQSFDTDVNPVVGAGVFSAFSGILTLASIVFIPLYIGIRVAAERQENNVDLLYVSTLSPGRIIRGKFFCGAYVALLFISCCMPFMAFTTLLRGVDLPTIFFNLFALFLTVCLAVQIAIFFACLPISKVLKIVLGLFAVFSMFPFGGSMVFFSLRMMGAGVGTMMTGSGFWYAFATSLAIGGAVLVMLYFLSVALISPASANRALPIRSYITVVWLLGAAMAFYWAYKTGENRLILAWTIPSMALLYISMLVVVSNEDELSLRVLRTVPRHPLKRMLAFLFYNGAAGGLVWVSLLMAATFLTTWLVINPSATWLGAFIRRSGISSGMGQNEFDEFTAQSGSFLLYAFAYGLTALWIHRRFLSRRPAKLAGVLAIVIPSAFAIVLYLALFFINKLSWKTFETMQPGNMINIFVLRDVKDQQMHLYCAGAMLMIFSVLNARWFLRQWRSFQRYERCTDAPPVIAAMPAVPAGAPVETVK